MPKDRISQLNSDNQVNSNINLSFDSSLPLADGKTGAVGTSPSPSRADHQHPLAIEAIYQALRNRIMNEVHPVHSLFYSTSDISPEKQLGIGKWEKIEGRFILGSSSNYPLNSTGGSANAVLVQHNHQENCTLEYPDGRQIAYPIGYNFGNAHEQYGVFPKPTGYQEGWGSGVRTFSEGESGVGKNMPPYQVVNIWERIE